MDERSTSSTRVAAWPLVLKHLVKLPQHSCVDHSLQDLYTPLDIGTTSENSLSSILSITYYVT